MHAGGLDAVAELGGKSVGDLVGVVAQRERPAAAVVIGIAGGNVPDCRLGLDSDELSEVVDRIYSLRGVPNLPDAHGRDLDWIAVSVVDLGLGRLEVANPGGNRDAAGKRIHPLQAGLAYGAAVTAEQLDHTGLSWRDGGQPGELQGANDQQSGPGPVKRRLHAGGVLGV